ncbi:hypothetical protein COV05_00875 [Candidatus Uhrbacteria bacterium CG10_big_fil_rev_8_21_14_0_10_48_16]|uniref:Uncharacterized protein n=1 Tax=Candidatus Uhrbacteria bacterium CG10_big_fil_rev_8_21_14_0_10_48_16 TaxID=1975038 RepID=A0A2M8LI78_9BACT|nr:MAG: hypothetical protein COV05_00875 [Candidatus Uhrbacteria bacterium CG10_big_fil_rev_8_21_14_0_10_48_16]
MSTIINTPANKQDSFIGLIITLLVVAIVAVLFFVYALPAIQNTSQDQEDFTTIEVNTPAVIDEIPVEPQE